MNKERQEYQKKLGFQSGYEFTCWMQENGILRDNSVLLKKENIEKMHKRSHIRWYGKLEKRVWKRFCRLGKEK